MVWSSWVSTTQHQLHRDAGARLDRRVGRVDVADAVSAVAMSPPETIHRPMSTRWRGVVPQDVVGPAALQPRGADVLQALDEEPALHVSDLLLAGSDPARRMSCRSPRKRIGCDTPRIMPFSFAGGDDRSAPSRFIAIGISTSVCLPAGDRLQRHLGVGLAGPGDDDDVDLGVGEGLVEVRRPLLVAVLLRERLGGALRPTGRCASPGFGSGLARPTTVCSTASGVRGSASECQMPIIPWPIMQTLSMGSSLTVKAG